MSVLRRGDENLHYSDTSHRWIAPPGVKQAAWDAGVRAHLAQHLLTMGGPTPRPEAPPSCGPLRRLATTTDGRIELLRQPAPIAAMSRRVVPVRPVVAARPAAAASGGTPTVNGGTRRPAAAAAVPAGGTATRAVPQKPAARVEAGAAA